MSQARIDALVEDKVNHPKVEPKRSNRPPEAPNSNLQKANASNNGYEAVSYFWGTTKLKERMLLDGRDFNAPYSAVEALTYLRQSRGLRVLWIDALCINQTDDTEKGFQVAMMNDIYANAVCTLVWLGPTKDDQETVRAIELCRIIAQQSPYHSVPKEEYKDDASLRSTCDDVSIPGDLSLKLLNVVFLRPWFKRLWVLQEVMLSSQAECYIGEFTIPWQHVALVALWGTDFVTRHDAPDQTPDMEAIDMMKVPAMIGLIGNVARYGWPLSYLMPVAEDSVTSDARDRIYGLLGMTTWSRSGTQIPSGIMPNYEESVRDVMRDATTVMIAEDKILDVLGKAMLDLHTTKEYWPSWTPQWHIPGRYRHFLQIIYRADNKRSLAIHQLSKEGDPDALMLRGFEIDRVERTHSISNDVFESIESMRTHFQPWCESVTAHTPVSIRTPLLTLMTEAFDGERLDLKGDFVSKLPDVLLGRFHLPQHETTSQPYGSGAKLTSLEMCKIF